MKTPVYNSQFYDVQSQPSALSAKHILPYVFSLWKPNQVDDVGCGIGTWASAAKELGVKVNGYDGHYVDLNQLLINPSEFHSVDLETDLDLPLYSDFVMCLEVAEHISPSRSEWLIQQLTKSADVVLFSAAIPYQGGVNHINERWQQFWVDLFHTNGFVPVDVLRCEIWNNQMISIEYRQNSQLFVRSGSEVLRVLSEYASSINYGGLDVCHPEMYLSKIDYVRFKNIGLRSMFQIITKWLYHRLSGSQSDAGLLD